MCTPKPRDQIWEEWLDLVNMTPEELDEWLQTDESRSVADTDDARSRQSRESGMRIPDIQRRARSELEDTHWDRMTTVLDHVRRLLRDGAPEHDLRKSRWRYTLMNSGHDPLKADRRR